MNARSNFVTNQMSTDDCLVAPPSRMVAGLLSTQSSEEILGRAIGFGLEPGHHAWPLGGKGIRSRAPVARRSRQPGAFAMRRADLARSPRVRQAIEKALEIRIAMREHMDGFTGGEAGEVMLHRSNFIEEPQGIQRTEDGAQPIPSGNRTGESMRPQD
jgi:hypothetical protein